MNKTDLIQFVKENAALSISHSEKAVNAVFEGLTQALSRKEEASFVNFGSFVITERQARKGRNPQTGKELNIPAKNHVKFRPGKLLKESVV